MESRDGVGRGATLRLDAGPVRRQYEQESQQTDKISEYVNKLSENSLENLSISSDTVTGNISLTQNKFLTFAIPYSTGWSAYVDGQKVDILQGNLSYMAIYLTAGDHEIKLVYNTPLFRQGEIISLLGIILLGGYIVVNECYVRKRKVKHVSRGK